MNSKSDEMFSESFDVTNPSPRVAVALVLDTSGSMDGAPIKALDEGFATFLDEVRNDEAASVSAEVMTITFDEHARVVHGFSSVSAYAQRPAPFVAAGRTATGEALELAALELEKRCALYKRQGIPHYAPFLVLMTDGEPVPNVGWQSPSLRLQQLAKEGKLNYLCIGVGDDVNWNTMDEIAGSEPGAQKLQGLKFGAFFKWLSQSLHAVSCAGVENESSVRFAPPTSWAELKNYRRK